MKHLFPYSPKPLLLWLALAFSPLPAAACDAPVNTAAGNLSTSGATLSWDAATGAIGYEYLVDQVAADPAGNGTPTLAISEPISGLTAATTYYLHVRTKCSPTSFSTWATMAFTTAACNAPAGLAVTNLTATGATISWTASPGATGYEYTVNTAMTDPAGAGTPIATSAVNAGGLTPNTGYYAHIRTQCGAGSYSPWSQVPFTTKPTAVAGLHENGLILRLYPNPASGVLALEVPVRAGHAAIRITDISGRTVGQQPVGSGRILHPITDLPAGLYLLRYTDEVRSGTVRFRKE